ncbi:Peptidyl-prolyl cis-trans isomerase FKBP16-2, chloroplastic [Apostasia shenzhenica]|uniref:peptidylprolyl isomerase n=1 Tax=Apostasia shenzhenica TaxID=1088818 RepID=A0A2I0ARA0_9ASPA|nr:Peptidyl-prolyl cis-trans isomerase FKBP16-2, chloroplastic [Apostasia shenzhenica]
MAATSALSVSLSKPRLLPRAPWLSNPTCSSTSSSSSFKPYLFPLSSQPSSSSLSGAGSFRSVLASRRRLIETGICLLAFSVSIPDANATRIEYYATVGERLCDLTFVKSGLGFCDIAIGTGVQPPAGELINVHYTARFADGIVFNSSYKRGRPLTMRIGVGKVIPGLDQGILGGGGVPPMQAGGKRKLFIPPKLAYGPEPVGCFSGDCNIPGNATLLYDILFVGIYK